MAAITSRDAAREDHDLADDMDVLEPSGVRRKGEFLEEYVVDDGPADVRVESFLECVEAKRQRSNRARVVILGVGALVAGVAYLTSIGVVGPDARTAAASVGTLLTGYLVSNGR